MRVVRSVDVVQVYGGRKGAGLMPILKFMLATLVTALCLDSVITHVEVLRVNKDLFEWLILMFSFKLVAASIMVAVALWCRSAWRAWRP